VENKLYTALTAENQLHIALTGHSTHKDLVKQIGLRRILFDNSCQRRVLFYKNLACSALFS